MTANSRKLTSVLLIDDDEVVNTLHTIILYQSGIVENIQSVVSGDQGILALQKCKNEGNWPAAIFVDINMPGMNGWEFIEMLSEKFPEYKCNGIICMLSSSLDPRDKEKASQSVLVDFYFSKPLSPEAVHTIWNKYNALKIGV